MTVPAFARNVGKETEAFDMPLGTYETAGPSVPFPLTEMSTGKPPELLDPTAIGSWNVKIGVTEVVSEPPQLAPTTVNSM